MRNTKSRSAYPAASPVTSLRIRRAPASKRLVTTTSSVGSAGSPTAGARIGTGLPGVERAPHGDDDLGGATVADLDDVAHRADRQLERDLVAVGEGDERGEARE